MTLIYANLNNKGRADNYTRQTIKKVEGSGSNMTITYEGEALDKNKKPLSSTPAIVSYTVYIRNGFMEWDMKSFATPGTEGLIEIEGDKLRIPSSLAPGVKLDDVNFTMNVNMGFKITTTIALTDQECIAIEEVKVPAGTFMCHKVKQTSSATAMRRTLTTKTITWYAPGIGTVKSETYNAKEQLQSSMALESIE
ncbi:MAG: hypothetical protein LBE79_03300 [Tannerella sp.]|jgi:hypothetical protein|nr:hypothetical protein [Tannerella sp.]